MRRLLRWILKLGLLLLLIVSGSVAWQGHRMYAGALKEMPLEEKIEEIREQPDYTPLSRLPKTYQNAVVAAEDHRFYQHPGIDVIAIGRAMKNNILAGSLREGGSTITQQLAKNLYFTQEKKFTRKAAEVFMALKLEKEYTKEEILELYVNTIYFGDGYYGIEEACQGYLNKDATEMTLADCTMMAGIPNAPSVYAPTANPDLTRDRQEKVISSMVEYNYLSETDANSLLNSLDGYYENLIETLATE